MAETPAVRVGNGQRLPGGRLAKQRAVKCFLQKKKQVFRLDDGDKIGEWIIFIIPENLIEI